MDCTFWNNLFANLPIFLLTQNPRCSPHRDTEASLSCNHLVQAEPGLTGCIHRLAHFLNKIAYYDFLEQIGQPWRMSGRSVDLGCLTKLHFDCVQPPYTWLGAIIWHYYFLLLLKRHFVRIHALLVIWISSRCALIFKSGIWTERFLHCGDVWFPAMLCFIVGK